MGKVTATPAALRDVLLAYLTQHPDASDTLEGISGWWLPEIHPPPSVEDLQTVLDDLVEEGRLARAVMAGGSVLYSRAR